MGPCATLPPFSYAQVLCAVKAVVPRCAPNADGIMTVLVRLMLKLAELTMKG